MKKISAVIIVVVIVMFAGGLYLKMSDRPVSGGGHVTYHCDSNEMPGGQLSFWIERQRDDQFHLIVSSKPPQTDIVVTRTKLGLFNYRYSGHGVEVQDSTSTLQVIYNGKQLNNCRKIYPGT